MKPFRGVVVRRSVQALLALGVGLGGLGSAQTSTPPWGDAQVREIVQMHGCTVYGLVSDPEHVFWVVCPPVAQPQAATGQ